MTQNEIALKILNMGKDGYKDDAEGFEKLNKANKLIEEHVTEQLRLYGVSVSLRFSDLYVVVKTDKLLYTDAVYDFKTAESVCSIAKDSGYTDAEVITLSYALRNGCVF